MADPTAGQVDDLVLIRSGRADAYQFKSAEYPGNLTFNRLVKPQRKRGGDEGPSLARGLADGWQKLRQRWPDIHVHLVTQQQASVSDRPGDGSDGSPRHFAAFLCQVLAPIREGEIALADVDPSWQQALQGLREACKLTEEDFASFLESLHIDVRARSPLPPEPSQRRSDIESLSSALHRSVGEAAGVVEFDADGVLELMGWLERVRLRSRHEFPVDLDTYAPLSSAVVALQEVLAQQSSGYVAVVGPPGAGKSTLLSQVFTGSPDRVVRYYAYVPRRAPARSAMTADAFLQDVVLMLDRSGLRASDHLLPRGDLNALRQSLADRLDVGGVEFASTGCRTIVVVDGLDHVGRELPDASGLLGELPEPEELPAGVLFVVGSRTLEPLSSHVRTQVEEGEAIIDLRDHRLPRASILGICSRASVTARLPQQVHERIADLSDGHPLSVGYLLNLLSTTSAESAESVLAAAPAYRGDLAANYRAVSDEVSEDDEIVEVLAVCSRLRVGFRTEWLRTWTSERTVRLFRDRLQYLFRRQVDDWHFFHDSFRQFAADRTARGDGGQPDDAEDALSHRRVAELCAGSDDLAIAAEELHHRSRAGQHDAVLRLADPAVFREQYCRLRSPELIRSDIETALGIAANRADVIVVLKLILALAEATERDLILERVDLPGLLFDVGLIKKAVAYCDDNPRVPLAHAYGLAARLADAEDPAGRRLFDLLDPAGIRGPMPAHRSQDDLDIVTAWAAAASRCRTPEQVITAARQLVDEHSIGDAPESEHNSDIASRWWSRYQRVMRALIDAAISHGDEETLATIADVVADQIATHATGGSPDDDDVARTRSHMQAVLADVQIRSLSALLRLSKSAGDRARHLAVMQDQLATPLFPETMLYLAERFAANGVRGDARRLLEATQYSGPLTVEILTSGGAEKAIECAFRYWRLRHLLANAGETFPELIAADPSIPAESDPGAETAVHCDTDAGVRAARIDFAVRALAEIDATRKSGNPMPAPDVWTTLVRIIHGLRRPSGDTESAFVPLFHHKSTVMAIMLNVASRHGEDLLERLCDLLADRFSEEPGSWPLYLRLDITNRLAAIGAIPSFHYNVLEAVEAAAATYDAESRLETISEVARGYAHARQIQRSQDLALGLIPMAFGVAYRSDYLFHGWVPWLGQALAEPGGARFVDDAAWLARLLKAAAPMSEGKYPSGSVDLPTAVAPAAPVFAVRLFEYLVRHGVVSHSDALANLLGALVSHPETGITALDVAADIAAEILAPVASDAYPDLAISVVAAAERTGGVSHAEDLAESVARRIDKYALRPSRAQWRQGLGVARRDAERDQTAQPASTPSRDWSTDELVLSDGERIARNEVAARIRTVEDIVLLRQRQAADPSFSWASLVKQLSLTDEDRRALANAFCSWSHRDVEVLVCLADSAEANGDPSTALRLASSILSHPPIDDWSSSHRPSRLRAAAIAVRLGGPDDRTAACRDVARYATSEHWVPTIMLRDLDDTMSALAPDIAAANTWPAIRSHLEGVAATLDLGAKEDLADHGCRWWLPDPTGPPRATSEDVSPATAIAELAVGHISHPTWPVRDGAIRVVARALTAGNVHVAEALARFAEAATTHDTLESAGRCLATARTLTGFVTPDALQPLNETLANHPSQVLRDLASEPPSRPRRPLRQAYNLALPQPTAYTIGPRVQSLAPHVEQYKLLSQYSGVDIEALLGVASEYASQALASLPTQDSIDDALDSAGMRHTLPTTPVAASREAFGKVLADLQDAGLFDDAPPRVRRAMRTIDVDALVRTPSVRPSLVPAPPNPDQIDTVDQWLAETANRLDQHVHAASADGRTLIAAISRFTVWNPPRLEEELRLAPTIGTGPDRNLFTLRDYATLRDASAETNLRIPDPGEPLVIENRSWTFHQMGAEWLAFRPDFAAAMGWMPDPSQPCRWFTSRGDLAAETIWWVDGSRHHGNLGVTSATADGHAVVLTPEGLVDVTNTFGAITTFFHMTRDTADPSDGIEPIKATRERNLATAMG
ncbi:MAG: hypothetical protein OXE75_06145 [bacterium]|nr:hypothetical protein [bacterium]